ncbi:MAG: homogentisate 1,2-dioxygenase, partial [Bacteroidia bacterium]|nr:homogentisate 1,2-dioxygenase [Bacteroidia bacterium]
MPIYHTLGTIPPKRHTQFRKPDNNLYYEQLFGTEGFHGFSSLLYHTHRPTIVKNIVGSVDVTPKIAVAKNMKSLRLKGFDVPPEKDFLDSRKTL